MTYEELEINGYTYPIASRDGVLVNPHHANLNDPLYIQGLQQALIIYERKDSFHKNTGMWVDPQKCLPDDLHFYFPPSLKKCRGIARSVYFFDPQTTLAAIKIGFTQHSLIQRLSKWRAEYPHLQLICIATSLSLSPRELEERFHAYFYNYRLERELFARDPILYYLENIRRNNEQRSIE